MIARQLQGHFVTDTIHYGLLIALAIALVAAAFTDIRRRQIDNWLNAAIALGAPLFWWASGLALWPDMVWQLVFAFIATAVLIGIYAIGLKVGATILGGGDVKLLAALSLWMTPLFYMQLLFIMAAVGGVMAFGFIVRRVVFKPKTPGVLPYGVAIAFGGLWIIFFNLFPQAAVAAAVL